MYQKIEETFWTDPKVSNLPPYEKLLFIYLITNSHVHYSGLYQISRATIQDETSLTPDALNKSLTSLIDNRLIRYDNDKKIVWVINMAKHQVQQGNKTNLIIGFAKQFNRLHNSALIKEFFIYYATLVDGILNPSEWDTDTLPESVALSSSIKHKQKAVTKEKQAPLRLSDSEWLDTLQSNPAYQHVDIAYELDKMEAWLTLPKNKARKKTKQFILNWLNKIDRPVNAGETQPPVPEPVSKDSVVKFSPFLDSLYDKDGKFLSEKKHIEKALISDYKYYNEAPRTTEQWEKLILELREAYNLKIKADKESKDQSAGNKVLKTIIR